MKVAAIYWGPTAPGNDDWLARRSRATMTSTPYTVDMTSLTTAQIQYLASQRLGRIATAGADRTPHVVPTSFRYNDDLGTIDVGGLRVATTKKYRDVQANPWAAIVVDDLASTDPWRPRMLEIPVFLELGDHSTKLGFPLGQRRLRRDLRERRRMRNKGLVELGQLRPEVGARHQPPNAPASHAVTLGKGLYDMDGIVPIAMAQDRSCCFSDVIAGVIDALVNFVGQEPDTPVATEFEEPALLRGSGNPTKWVGRRSQYDQTRPGGERRTQGGEIYPVALTFEPKGDVDRDPVGERYDRCAVRPCG